MLSPMRKASPMDRPTSPEANALRDDDPELLPARVASLAAHAPSTLALTLASIVAIAALAHAGAPQTWNLAGAALACALAVLRDRTIRRLGRDSQALESAGDAAASGDVAPAQPDTAMGGAVGASIARLRAGERAIAWHSGAIGAYVGWAIATGAAPWLESQAWALIGAGALVPLLAAGGLASAPRALLALALPAYVGAIAAVARLEPAMPAAWAALVAMLAAVGYAGWRQVLAQASALRAQVHARRLAEREWSLFDANPLGVAVTREQRIERANAMMLRWFAPDGTLDRLPAELARRLGRDPARLQRLLRRADVRIRDRRIVDLELALEALPARVSVRIRRLDPARPDAGLVWSVTDRSARPLAGHSEEDAALVDGLTGGLNRQGLVVRLHTLLQRDLEHRPLATLSIDINGFRQLNERHGRPFGDHVLRALAERLRHTLRGSDLVARPNADEFVIVLDPIQSRAEAVAVAERIGEVIAGPMVIEGMVCRVRAAIGVACAPEDGRTVDDLLALAEREMVTIKRAISPANRSTAARTQPDRRSPR